MASTIVTKNSSTASAVPVSGDLTQGELAVNVTDKKLYTKDSGGTVVKLVGGLGNQEANAVAITGGSINGTTVGATTASTGAFTTLSASSTVSGTGFSTYLASPPAIGGTAAAAGSFTTLSASGNTTLSGGTANGVAYLNGSKVVTTGSALTFDGTNLGVGGVSNTYSGYTVLTLNNAVNGPIFDLNYAGTRQATFLALTNEVRIGSIANSPFTFYQNGSEQMRLTSTGLGIGTSSPSEKLTVAGAGLFTGALANYRTSSAAIDWFNGITRIWGFGANSSTAGTVQLLTSSNNGSVINTLTYDSSGNLGLGVTPSAWLSGAKAIQIGAGGYVDSRGSVNLDIGSNAYIDSSASWRYINTGAATQARMDSGAFSWLTAPSGTAGNAITFTQAMTLDASGNLGIGTTTTSPYRLNVLRSDGKAAFMTDGSTADFAVTCISGVSMVAAASTGVLALGTSGTERARIDSSGNLLVGTTTGGGAGGLTTYPLGSGAGSAAITVWNKTNTAAELACAFRVSATNIGTISYSNTSVAYNTTSDYRLKHDIAPMTGALAKVTALKPVTYKWNADDSDGEGFIAHELAEVVPQCVTGEKDAVDAEGKPVYQGIDTSFLVATLTAAIQELKAEFDAYKATHP